MSDTEVLKIPSGAWDTHVHLFDHPPPMIVRGQSFTFPHAPAWALDAMHAQLNLDRAVIVDGELGGDAVLIAQLEASGGRYRGVAKFKAEPSVKDLERLHAAGVRGCRFYFHDMLGPSTSPDFYKRIVDMIAPFGWHVLIFTLPKDLLANERLLRRTAVPLVLDHLCMIDLAEGLTQPAMELVLDLQTSRDTYVKISGGDRRSNVGAPSYSDDVPFARRVIENDPARVLWASDWPFVMYKRPGQMGHPPPAPGDLLNLLLRSCRSQRELDLILRDTPAKLYG